MPSETARTEAFSDGVFAIAVTLLVLNLQPPPGRDLVAGLLAQWPAYIGYLVSFLTIGIMWVNHHGLFTRIEKVDRRLMFINLLLLMFVAVVPFPTALVSRHLADSGSHVAAAVYGGVMLGIALCFNALSVYAVRAGLAVLPRDAPLWRFLVGTVVYAVSIPAAFIDARLAVAIFAAMALYYVFEQLPTAEPGA